MGREKWIVRRVEKIWWHKECQKNLKSASNMMFLESKRLLICSSANRHGNEILSNKN